METIIQYGIIYIVFIYFEIVSTLPIRNGNTIYQQISAQALLRKYLTYKEYLSLYTLISSLGFSLPFRHKKDRGCREMASIKEGGVTQNESHLPKFLHKKS